MIVWSLCWRLSLIATGIGFLFSFQRILASVWSSVDKLIMFSAEHRLTSAGGSLTLSDVFCYWPKRCSWWRLCIFCWMLHGESNRPWYGILLIFLTIDIQQNQWRNLYKATVIVYGMISECTKYHQHLKISDLPRWLGHLWAATQACASFMLWAACFTGN